MATNNSCNYSFSTYIEDGTYTPTLTGSSVAGSTTYTLQAGFYSIIGKRIWVDAQVQYTAATGTGNMQISMPFASRNTSNHNYRGSCTTVNITLPTNAGGALDPDTNRPLCAALLPNSSQVTMFSSNSDASGDSVAMASPSSGTGIVSISISYLLT